MAEKTKLHGDITVDRIKARIRENTLKNSEVLRESLRAFENKGFSWRGLLRFNVRLREKFIALGLRHKDRVKELPLVGVVLKKIYNSLRYPDR